MTNDLKKKIDEVEALAKELLPDSGENTAKITAAKHRIAEIELGLLKEGKNGNAYFPLLRRFNGAIPFDIFVDDFYDVLMSVLKNYDPDKGIKFSAFFYSALNSRVISSYDKFMKWLERNRPLSDEIEAGNGLEMEDLSPEIMAVYTFAPIIADIKKYNDSLKSNGKSGEKESIWFERFYTFDTTKAVKEDGVYAEIVKTYDVNKLLFPLMKELLLRFLIILEEFKHMCDVVDNKLRRDDVLNNYAKTITECYKSEKGASERTVINRHKKYKDIMEEIHEKTKAKLEIYSS